MRSAPKTFYKTNHSNPDVMSELRDILSSRPEALNSLGSYALAVLLYGRNYVTEHEVFEVEAALEALAVEGEVLA